MEENYFVVCSDNSEVKPADALVRLVQNRTSLCGDLARLSARVYAACLSID